MLYSNNKIKTKMLYKLLAYWCTFIDIISIMIGYF